MLIVSVKVLGTELKSPKTTQAISSGFGYPPELVDKTLLLKTLTCCSWLAQPAFLQHPGPPAQEWHCPRYAGPSYIDYQSRKGTTGLSTGQFGGGIFSGKGPSSKMTIACVELA